MPILTSRLRPCLHLGGRRGCIDTVIRGIEMISARPRLSGFPILLPKRSPRKTFLLVPRFTSWNNHLKTVHAKNRPLTHADRVCVRTNQRNKTQRAGVIEQKVCITSISCGIITFVTLTDGISKRYTAADLLLIAKSTEQSDAPQVAGRPRI